MDRRNGLYSWPGGTVAGPQGSGISGGRIAGGRIAGGYSRRAKRHGRRFLLSMLAMVMIGVAPIVPGAVPAADAVTFSEDQTLTAPGTPTNFGWVMANDENVLAVAQQALDEGAAVKIYRRSDPFDDWTLDQIIPSPVEDIDFGRSLALRDGQLAVGALESVYWYFEDAGQFGSVEVVNDFGSDFGAAVAFDTESGRLLVGAPDATPASVTTGVVYSLGDW